jgi:hypothetical protein
MAAALSASPQTAGPVGFRPKGSDEEMKQFNELIAYAM